MSIRLFLLRLLSLSLRLSSLLPRTSISLLGSQLSQLHVRSLLTLWQVTLLDLGEAMSQTSTGVDGERGRNLGDDVGFLVVHGLDVFGGAVEFLVLAGFAGEEDQAGLVRLQAGDVCG